MPAHNHEELQLRLVSLGTAYRRARQAYLINGHNAGSLPTLIAERQSYEGEGGAFSDIFLKSGRYSLQDPTHISLLEIIF